MADPVSITGSSTNSKFPATHVNLLGCRCSHGSLGPPRAGTSPATWRNKPIGGGRWFETS